jgi:hypothetical protein
MHPPTAHAERREPERWGVGSAAAAGTPLRPGLVAIALFGVALLLRLHFYSGFVLGDDAEEFPLIQSLVLDGPSFEGHLRYRVPMWIFNVASGSWLGLHEAVFFLPTWLVSSLLPVLGYATVRALRYPASSCLFVGLFVALSPFEVLMGSVRANDLFLTFFLALAFYLAVRLQDWPTVQGLGVAAALWAGFYAKLWIVFVYPVAGLYFLGRALRRSEPRGLLAFAGGCLVLHLATCAFWRWELGTWLPFVENLSASYPVPPEALIPTLLEYPKLILLGSSERGHTLFGAVPYLLLAALALRVSLPAARALRRRGGLGRLDGVDVWLLAGYGSFLLLLNFFPNSFVFDRYYSAPRIFRYLSPLSFFFSLHAAKLLVDLGRILPVPVVAHRIVAVGLLALLAVGTGNALATVQEHRRVTTQVRALLRASCPPVVVMESWQGFFFRELHLRDACPDSWIAMPAHTYDARDYEVWLRGTEPELPAGAVLVTGLPSWVHYACLTCGLRLGVFEGALHPSWKLSADLGALDFDDAQEAVRLWTLAEEVPDRIAGPLPRIDEGLSAAELFARGIEHFDAAEYPETRAYMQAIPRRSPRRAEAAYYDAVSFWREGNLYRTITRFQALIRRYPRSSWVGPSQYHIGLAYRAAGSRERARRWFELAAKSGPAPVDTYALAELDRLDFRAPLSEVGRGLTELVYHFQAVTHPRWEDPEG